jgi:putative phosphoesterase
MQIAIISDTHDNIPNIKKAIFLINKEGISTIIHCGDITTLESFEVIRSEFKGDLFLAQGNADINPEEIKMKAVLMKKTHFKGNAGKENIGGLTVGFTHYPWLAKKIAKGTSLTSDNAKGGGYDVIFYGHSHTPWEEQENGIQLLNPGTVSGMFCRPTFAIYDTLTKKAKLILL